MHRLLTQEKSQNIVIFGAHRSGKTSVINMVVDGLNKGIFRDQPNTPSPKNSLAKPIEVIAIKIETATTPPEDLFYSIIMQIKKLSEGDENGFGEKVRTVANRFLNFCKDFSPNLALNTMDINGEIALPMVLKVKLGLGFKILKPDESQDEEQQTGETKAMGDKFNIRLNQAQRRAEYLRTTTKLLKLFLDGWLKKDSEPDLDKEKFRIVIALDEIGDMQHWGGEWAFPSWRHIIESPDFRRIKWLFSTSHGLTEDTKYSPLSNALREYNLLPLQDQEAIAFIQAFEYAPKIEGRDFGDSFWGSPPEDDTKVDSWREQHLRPTVTYKASRYILFVTGQLPFFMQVACCLIFEQAVRYHIPVITEDLADSIIMSLVSGQLHDYFESIWANTPKDLRAELKVIIPDKVGSLLPNARSNQPVASAIDSSLRVKLIRSGLGGTRDGNSVVPLFCYWLRRSHNGV